MNTLINKKTSTNFLLYLTFIISLCFCIHFNGLNGPLFLDSHKLYQLENIRLSIKDLSFSGYGRRFISQFTFYLNTLIDNGINTFNIKLTNVFIHILTGICIFILSSKLALCTTHKKYHSYIAAIVFSLWLLSPINTSSVLYAIQRMNQLSALFCLIALIFYINLRASQKLGQLKRLKVFSNFIIILLCWALAISSKENAILLVLFFILLEIFFFKKDIINKENLSRKFAFLTSIFILAVVTALLFPEPINDTLNYDERSFTITERALTQTRIIWIYIIEIILPHSTSTGLFHDGIPISKNLLSPISTFFSIIGLVVTLIVSTYFAKNKKLAPISFGISFFIIGHLLESTIIPLELYYEHRNYLPSFGIYFAIAFSLLSLRNTLSNSSQIICFTLYISLFLIVGYFKVETYANATSAYLKATQRTYSSPRAASNLAHYFFTQNQIKKSIETLSKIIEHYPHEAQRARLQIMYMSCSSNKINNKNLYRDITLTTSKESKIEISQSLENLINVIQQKKCSYINTSKLRYALLSISNTLEKNNKSSWYIDYYIAQLFIIEEQTNNVINFLSQKLQKGELRAGYYLQHLNQKDPSKYFNKELPKLFKEYGLNQP